MEVTELQEGLGLTRTQRRLRHRKGVTALEKQTHALPSSLPALHLSSCGDKHQTCRDSVKYGSDLGLGHIRI